MKLSKSGNKFELTSTFEERAFPKDAGFRWDPARKIWWTDNKEKAARLAEYGTDDVRAELGGLASQQKQALQESRAVAVLEEEDFDLPIPEGLAYLPFQRAGIAYAAKRPSTLFGDEMGLGKTIQAIGLINATPTMQRILVICPASLKINWRRELEKFLVRPFDIQMVNGKPLDLSMPGRGQIIILNYDILKKHKAALLAMKFDLLILDEAHYIKNGKAQRTKLVQEIAANCARKTFLTGTPILNRPVELWTLLQILDPLRWTNFFQYAMRYCAAFKTRWGWDFSGASHLDELQRILRETVMVRRLKKDVLTDLPAKRRQIIEIPAAGCEDVLREEQEAEDRFDEEVEALETARDFAAANDNQEEYEEAVRKLREAKSVAFAEMAKRRHATALAKVPNIIEHVTGLLEQVDKVILFAHHLDVIDGFEAGLAAFHPLRLTGRESKDERQANIDAFQREGSKHQVIIVSITIAVGFTLTAASMEVFAELDWVPGTMTQAEDRAHRIGQTESVLIHHVVLEGSMDARLAKTLVAKQEVIDKALDRAAAALQVEVPKRKRAARPDLPALREDQIPYVLQALQILAQRCDGAREVDGAGFNKIDTRFGKDLAARGRLTENQAAFGLRMVSKYRKQLPADLRESLGIGATL